MNQKNNILKIARDSKNKKAVFSVSLVLLLCFSMLIVSMPSANAAVTQWTTYFYVMVAPNPVGVGQTTIITLQIDKTNPLATGVAGGENFNGLMAKITRPDGTVETKGPYLSYAIANTFFLYTPTQVGTYTVEGSWPGQWANTSTYQRYYKPSSGIATFNVTANPIPSYENIPLPSGYWTRPLSSEIKDWSTVADNWLMPRYDDPSAWRFSYTAVAPYTSAPDSAHVLWKKPVAFGGTVGGQYGDISYRTGLSYEPWYASSLILSGRIIYTVKGASTADVFGTRILDLYTGEEIKYLDGVNIAFAQTLNFNSPNEHGALAYLWETTGTGTNGTWKMYDAFEMKHTVTITNITSGTTRTGPNGEILSYSFSGTGANRRLIMWNSTKALADAPRAGVNEYFSPATGSIVDGRKGIEWNVSIPRLWADPSIQIAEDGYILARYRQSNTAADTQYPPLTLDVAYSTTIQKLQNGSYPDSINHLWAVNRTDIEAHGPYLYNKLEQGVYVDWDEALARAYGYDIQSGQKLWTTQSLTGWGLFSGYYSGGFASAYGKFYCAGYDGHIRAYNIRTGVLEWDYYMGDAPYLENAYGTWPVYGFTIADHKVFVTNDEHSPDQILWRGAKLTVLDADTGKVNWRMDGRLRQTIVSDGILSALNVYDMQIYTLGKGPSKTTVTAPQAGAFIGSPITITGTVTDQTPASKDTPAISDESMSAWMAYLHMQKPKPTNATGVSVTLVAVDANGDVTELGSATSDMYGNFGFAWTPTKQGTYQIIANFAGTISYGESSASTYVTVSNAPANIVVTPTPTQTTAPTQPPTTATVAPTTSPSAIVEPGTGISTETLLIIGAAVVIIAVVAAAAVLLRKRV